MYRKPVALRGLALLIDFIFIMIIGLILNLLFGYGTLTVSNNMYNFTMNWWEATIVAIFYFSVLEYIFLGKSIGKAILGLEVRYEDMHSVDKRIVYFIRGFSKGLIIITAIISWIMMLATDSKKAIHDYVFKTIVVKKIKNSELVSEELSSPLEDIPSE